MPAALLQPQPQHQHRHPMVREGHNSTLTFDQVLFSVTCLHGDTAGPAINTFDKQVAMQYPSLPGSLLQLPKCVPTDCSNCLL